MRLAKKISNMSSKVHMKNLILTSKSVLKQITQFYEEKIS